MWTILLAKYWKETILITLLVSLAGWFLVDETLDNRREKNLQQKVQYQMARAEICEQNVILLQSAVEKQSAMVEQWKKTAEDRAISLEDALSRPPKTIYRDRIVEVPSIVTGDCEQVFTDIENYMRGVLDADG